MMLARANLIAEAVVGKSVLAVYVSEDVLLLETDQGPVAYDVEGDCCSHSYFHDVVGVRKLIENGPVLSIEEVHLLPDDVGYHDPDCPGSHYDYEKREAISAPCGGDHDCLQVYGYRLITESPTWGEQSTVIAFRNDSNGYYGGWMSVCSSTPDPRKLRRVIDDWDADRTDA